VRVAVEAGAHGCVSKGASHAELVNACRELLAGGSYFCPAGAKALRLVLANRSRDAELNSTEQKILRLVAEGMEPKDIAECVGVEVGTVRNYMVQIRQKIGVTSMVNLAKYAVEHGFAPPD
jgi:DNA-binding NarL/FixJ family response regulator